MKKEFAVLGLGKFGLSLAKSLADADCEVIVIDRDAAIVDEVTDNVVNAMVGDVTNKEFINSLGLSNYDAVIVGIGDDLEACVMATILAREAGARLILAKAGSELQARILRKVGADSIIFPEKESGIRIANQLVRGNYFDAIELSDMYSIVEIPIPESWIGHTFISLNLRSKHKVNVIGIRRDGNLAINPEPDNALKENDVLVVLGDNDNLERLRKVN